MEEKKKHECTVCKGTFTEYSYYTTCGLCCGSGENDHGGKCFQCGGMGDYKVASAKNICEGCAEQLEDEW